MLNEHVDEADKSTVEDKSVTMLGETDVSIKLNSSISLEQAILPLPLTLRKAKSRMVMAWSIMICNFCGDSLEVMRVIEETSNLEDFMFLFHIVFPRRRFEKIRIK